MPAARRSERLIRSPGLGRRRDLASRGTHAAKVVPQGGDGDLEPDVTAEAEAVGSDYRLGRRRERDGHSIDPAPDPSVLAGLPVRTHNLKRRAVESGLFRARESIMTHTACGASVVRPCTCSALRRQMVACGISLLTSARA